MRPGLFHTAVLSCVLGLSAAVPGAVAAESLPAVSLLEEKDEIARRIDQRVALLTDKLDLNESQQANAEECLRAAVDKFREIRDDATLPDERKKSLWASSRKAYRGYLRSLLTDEQQDAFDALLASLAQQAKADRKAGKEGAADPAPSSSLWDPRDPLLDDLTPVTSS